MSGCDSRPRIDPPIVIPLYHDWHEWLEIRADAPDVVWHVLRHDDPPACTEERVRFARLVREFREVFLPVQLARRLTLRRNLPATERLALAGRVQREEIYWPVSDPGRGMEGWASHPIPTAIISDAQGDVAAGLVLLCDHSGSPPGHPLRRQVALFFMFGACAAPASAPSIQGGAIGPIDVVSLDRFGHVLAQEQWQDGVPFLPVADYARYLAEAVEAGLDLDRVIRTAERRAAAERPV